MWLRESISDSSEDLLQRGREEVSIARDFSEGYLQVSMHFGRDLLLVKRSKFTDDFSAF